MRISEYVKILEALRKEHGDIEVHTYMHGGRRIVADAPVVDHLLILNSRESVPRFASDVRYAHNYESRKGLKVVKV